MVDNEASAGALKYLGVFPTCFLGSYTMSAREVNMVQSPSFSVEIVKSLSVEDYIYIYTIKIVKSLTVYRIF